MVKDTVTLLHEIQEASDIDAYLDENEAHLSSLSFSEYVTMLLKKMGLTVADVQRRGRLTNYVYEIFSGSKTPTRNTVLQLCFGFALTVDDAQKLLRMAKTGTLYPKDRRDSILLFSLKEGLDCAAVNDLLDKKGMECFY